MNDYEKVKELSRTLNRTPLYPEKPTDLPYQYVNISYWNGSESSRYVYDRKLQGRITLPSKESGIIDGKRWRYPTRRARSHLTPISLVGNRVYTSGSISRIESGVLPNDISMVIDPAYIDGEGGPVAQYNAEERCHVEVINKLTDGKLQLGADAAEIKKTLNMIASSTHDVLSAYRSLRRGNFTRALQHLRLGGHSFKASRHNLSGRWLELQYGWLPTLGTISDGAALIQRRAAESRAPMSVTRTIVVPIPHNKFRNFSRGTSYSTSGTLSVRTKIWYRIASDTAHLASQIGVSNPAAIAWELVPFSFVLDWFLPVGNLMSQFSDTNGLDFISAHTTWRSSGTSRVITDWRIANGSSYSGTSEAVFRFEGFRRRVEYSFPYGSAYIKSPFSSRHLINAIALINQRWK